MHKLLALTYCASLFAGTVCAQDFHVLPAVKRTSAPSVSLNILPSKVTMDGYFIEVVDEDSPLAAMKSANPAETDDPPARAEKGDVITHINGKKIADISDYYTALKEAGTEARITIADIQNGESTDWIVKTAARRPPQTESQVNSDGPRVHVIYAALTHGDRLSECIRPHTNDFEETVRNLIGRDYLASYTALFGTSCTAAHIRATIQELTVQPDDALFVYYQGHGAYDPTYAVGDPSEGHFLQLPGEGLLRSELLALCASRKPRLVFLSTDCCNVQGTVTEPSKASSIRYPHVITGWTALERLLLSYSGVADITASSRGEFAWYDTLRGGWYSSVFIEQSYKRTTSVIADDDNEWSTFMGDLRGATNLRFLDLKARFKENSDGTLRMQASMLPRYTLSVARTNTRAPLNRQRTIIEVRTRTVE